MKKTIFAFIVILIAAVSACSAGSSTSTFNGSRTGNDSQFIMEYTALNMTDSQDLDVKAGDTIHGKIVVEGGLVAYKIQRDNDETIVEKNGLSTSDEFDIKVDESGTYTVTVTGEKAKGSVRFIVQRTE